MASNNTPAGRFVWFDNMTRDPAAAVSFYTTVVGWSSQRWDGPQPYTIFLNDGNMIGGVAAMPPSEQAPPHWLGYVSTPNVDDTVESAKKLGATVHVPPTDIPTVGRFAVLADPQGAAFAVYASDEPRPDTGNPMPGEFSWHELATTDHKKAWSFYESLFGWEKGDAMDMGPLGIYQLFSMAGLPCGGMFDAPAEYNMPPNWCHYAMVTDIKAAAGRVTAAGGKIINGPMEVPGGDWILQGFDPQGALFALHARKPA